MTRKFSRFWTLVTLVGLCASLLGACRGINTAQPTPPAGNPPTAAETLVTFIVTLPAPLQAGETLYVSLLDEVSGLAFNGQSYAMNAEDIQRYSVLVPIPLGSVVEYRYTRQGSLTAQEHNSDGRPVRYRLLSVPGPMVVRDVVSRWSDTAYTLAQGRIAGQVVDAQSNQPIPNVLVTAGGVQTFSSADGSYLLEGLPPGTHMLVAYSVDGSYRPYQQEASVAPDSTTPAPLSLQAATLVNITFAVSVPADTPADAPLRFAGNLWQLGNAFDNLAGGLSSVAARMPTLGRLPDGRYSITLTLPAGTDLRYKYTLGNGLWSAEQRNGAELYTRQLIVPASNTLVEETVETWHAPNAGPLTFEVGVPAETPAGEGISIQFNPGFGWTEPIPMWAVGENRWRFVFTGPMGGLSTLRYRYCRADQCNSGDDASTAGENTTGRSITLGSEAQTLNDTVSEWMWSQPVEPATVPDVAIAPRGESFFAGVEFQPSFEPSWGPLWPKAMAEMTTLGANWLVLTPTWSFNRQQPPVLGPLPASDMPWPEASSVIVQARQQGLNVAVFPSVRFSVENGLWFQNQPRDFAWWVGWFDRYRTFALHHADLAMRNGATALVLGGDWLAPALPGGLLANGSPSGVPGDAEARWRQILAEVRGRFNGTLLWALPYPQGVENPPPFLDAVDQVYVLWQASLSDDPNAPAAELSANAGQILDNQLKPFQEKLGKPVLLAIDYASADGSATGCIRMAEEGCLGSDWLARPNADVPGTALDLQEQADAYNAIFEAVNARPWIAGVVARGYYPPLALQDKSASVHGKPAAGVLWYWFPRLRGK